MRSLAILLTLFIIYSAVFSQSELKVERVINGTAKKVDEKKHNFIQSF
jgi:hypothetical protein